MRAAVYREYGPPDVVHVEQVAKPEPKAHQLLVRVRASTVGTWDCEARAFAFPLWLRLPLRLAMGVRRPRWRVLGQELAGEVEAVGAKVEGFAPGDRVFGAMGLGFGAHAEYACVSRELAEASGVRAVIDRRFPLERAAEAHAYVGSGRRTGAVVLTMDDDATA